MAEGKTPRYKAYNAPAGGWGAAAATAGTQAARSTAAIAARK